MPDHTNAPVARRAAGLPARHVTAVRFFHPVGCRRARRPQRFRHRHVDRVELVVAGHLFDDHARSRVGFKHDEMPNQVQKSALLEHAPQHDLQLRHGWRRNRLAGNRPPRHEPFPVGADCPDPRLQPVRNHQHRVVNEERRNLEFVGLELIERAPDVGALIRCVLQLDHRQRQPVDEDHDVRSPVVLSFDHRELIYRQPIVRVGVIPIHQPNQIVHRAPILLVLDRHPLNQQPMKGVIVGNQRRMLRHGDFAESVFERFRRYVRVERGQRVAQPLCQHRLAEAGPLGVKLAGRDVRAVLR